MVNANMLHTTRMTDASQPTIQKLHLFETTLLSGASGGKIEQTYFLPIIADPTLEIMAFSPDNPAHAVILQETKEAFVLDEREIGYEIRLQRILLDIWLKIYLLHA